MPKAKKLNDVPEQRLYILMRNDLPSLNAGKAMAQAAHASNQLIHEFGNTREVKRWQGNRGFGTTIVLSATGKQVIDVFARTCSQETAICAEVHDDTYPYITTQEIASLVRLDVHTASPIPKDKGQVILFRRELTCAYVLLPSEGTLKDELLGDLSLHP